MKNVFGFFITAMILLSISCTKEEVLNQPKEEVSATEFRGRILNCSFEPSWVSTAMGGSKGYEDGTLNSALLNTPSAIAIDKNRQIAYVADWENHAIRAIKGNRVTTLVGGVQGDSEGKGSNARLNGPSDLAIDNQGNLFVVDRFNHKIRKVTPEGKMTTFAGGTLGFANGIGVRAKFRFPFGITIDENGTLYVSDDGNVMIRSISPAGLVGYLAGSTHGFNNADVGTTVRFNGPRGLTIGVDGALYVADYGNNMIRRVERPWGKTTTFSGQRRGNSDGPRGRATFNRPSDIICDKEGNFFITDSRNNKIRFISANRVGSLAGNFQGNENGSSDQASFKFPMGLTFFNDNLYVADAHNDAIRRISVDYRCR